jgi:hypothetical protein
VRFREDTPAEQRRAREAVTAWRAANPQGTPAEMLASLAGRFHPNYGPVLRSVLITADRHTARTVTGIVAGRAGPGR